MKYFFVIHRLKKILLYFIPVLSYSLSGFTDYNWEKTKEKNGILTFHKSDNTRILQLKGVIVIDTSIDIVGGIFRDIPRHQKWIGFCKQAKILKIVDNQHYIFYETLEPPWPVSKKDMIMDSIATYYNTELMVSIASNTITSQLVSETNEFDRMKEMEVNINFEYVTANKTGISYKLKINPDSDAPPFIINFFNKMYLFDNMQNLKRLSDDKIYIQNLANKEDTETLKKILNNPTVLKTTLQNRLGRYIQSTDNIKHLSNDSLIIKNWQNNENQFAELLFLGIHDPQYQRKALESIMSIYLKKFSLTEEEINKLVNSPKVIEKFKQGNIEKEITESFIKTQNK